jgi:carbonic anhydrase
MSSAAEPRHSGRFWYETGMTETDRLLDNAGRYAESFDGAGLDSRPRTKVAVLTCMDARLNPYALLGLREGDAHVIRNAGGVVSDDAIRSLALSQHLLGTEEIVLIHHTGCGMLGDEEEIAARLEREAGRRPDWPLHAFDDLELDLRDGMERLEASPFIAHKDRIRGFVFEVESGRLREVERSR